MYKKLFYILFLVFISNSCTHKETQTEDEEIVVEVDVPDEEYEEQETYPDEYSEEDEYYDDIEDEDVIYNRNSTFKYWSDSLTLITNDSLIQRNFKSKLKEKYTDSAFDYTRTRLKESLWSKFERIVSEYLSEIFVNTDIKKISKYTMIFLRVFIGMIFALSIYYLIKLINKKNGTLFFSEKDKKVDIYDTDIIEDINEIDFNKIISQYELEKNYNSAFRYQFLSVLKNLTDSGKIKWTQEKTNIDYLIELKDTEIKKQFERAVYIFNHVWYGDFKINQEKYNKYVEEIKSLKTNTYE